MGLEHRTVSCSALAALLGAASIATQAAVPSLAQLSLEELGNIEITSVSKRAERLSDAPTAVFVITADDIRRSGATRLPEVLRLAPNLHVARVSAGEWAISARGFNGSSANKLLVLIDGRSVYTPFFAGVFWDVQNVLLEDVERIEVISGPGGTLWGVNAVNGIINVTTRSAAATPGSLVSVGGGNQEGAMALRHGLSFGDTHLRVHAQHHRHRHTHTADGRDKNDALHMSELGFRADTQGLTDRWTLQGSAYTGQREQPPPGVIATGVPFALGTISVSGGSLLGRWERRLGDDASVAVQAYVDRTKRVVPPTFAETLDIVDLQIEHASKPAPAHTLVWGGEYRHGIDRVTGSSFIVFPPARLHQRWGALFAQDEIALRDDLHLTLGARVEHNDYTGIEFLPNARLAWKWAPNHLLWTAASRTVRAPSRLDRDTFVPGTPPFLLRGGPDFRSETAKVFELGYRGQPTPTSTLSATAFHGKYEGLRTQEVAPSRTFAFFATACRAAPAASSCGRAGRPCRAGVCTAAIRACGRSSS